MNASATELSYRRSAVQEASPAGLMVILYDLLVEDLQRAVQAITCGDIEERSRQMKHALLVLELLESSLNQEKRDAMALSLAAFYGYLRGRLFTAQFHNDAGVLARQIALILDVREAWSTADANLSRSSAGYALPPFPPAQNQHDDTDEHPLAGWSA